MSEGNNQGPGYGQQNQNVSGQSPQDAAAMRNFVILYGGQILSFLGTSLSGFAIGVWIFQQTGSVMDLSLIHI